MLKIEVFRPHDPGAELFGALAPEVPPGSLSDEWICLAAVRDGVSVGRCAVRLVEDLHGAPGRTAVLGYYAAQEAEAGMELLATVQQVEAHAGTTRVLGPMDGSTWERYRFALPSHPDDPVQDAPPFLTEPWNPPDYPAHFLRADFTEAALYESRLDEEPGRVRDGAERLAARIGSRGIEVRPLMPERFEEELREIFGLSLRAFADNRYYTPLTFERFAGMYERLRPVLDPELVLLAHAPDGRLLGFAFAFPDPLEHGGGQPYRVVLKTVATAPEARIYGLGMHLGDRIRALAHAKGYRQVIHALMHVSNDSVKMSGRHAGVLLRRYALYEWRPAGR